MGRNHAVVVAPEPDLQRAAADRRTDPRLELIVFVTAGVEREVRRRLQVVADELIDLTGDVVVIQRQELPTLGYLTAPKPKTSIREDRCPAGSPGSETSGL